MEIESTSFVGADLDRFLDELVDQDRRALIERLERASARLEELAERMPDAPAGEGDGWSAQEVLAHIAVLSKFYGVLAYRIGTGAMTELDLLGQVHLRDVAGERMARQPATELVRMATADHRRTLQWLGAATPPDLRRRCRTGPDASMSAEEFARLALCAHLELHLRQLEAAIEGRQGSPGSA